MEKPTFITNLFAGKTAIVTGGTSGIGKATSIYLAQLGAKVYALGLKADQFKVPAGLDIESIEFDVTNEEKVTDFFAKLPSLDILFNNAGANFDNQYDYETFKRLIDLNLNSVFLLSKLSQPLLAKSSIASIVNVSSMYANFGGKDYPAYSASKGGVDQLTKSLAIYFADDNIRVNAVAPGWIDTPILAPLKNDPTIADPILARTPMKRFGNPVEIGQVVAFLSSPAASFINGTIITIDGGYSAV